MEDIKYNAEEVYDLRKKTGDESCELSLEELYNLAIIIDESDE